MWKESVHFFRARRLGALLATLPSLVLVAMNCRSPAGDADPAMDAPPPCAECPAPPVFINEWGGRGLAPGQFIEPSSIEMDSQGIVIVAGHENRVQRFDGNGVLLDIFGVAGQGEGQFNHPHGLAMDRERGDLLYVGDQENHRLQVFTSDGAFVRLWGDAQFRHIHDVGIDRQSGELFVGDLETHLLRKFSATGELLANFGGLGSGPAQFNGLWGISTDSQGFVYIADTNNRRVQKLDREGAFVAEWTSMGEQPFVKPTGVFVDNEDRVYVCDALAQVIAGFTVEGELVESWYLPTIYGQRSEPEDIVIDPTGKDIYIAEVYGHRVLHLQRVPAP